MCLALYYRIVTELSALPLSISLFLSSCVQYKKSKSSKKGKSLDDDTNLFDPESKVDGSPTVVSTRSPSPLRNISPSSVSLAPKATSSAPTVVQNKDELDPLPMPPPLIPASKASDQFDTQSLAAADDNDGWEHSDFFNDNAFGSVPFSQDKAAGGTSSGDDDFGFPTNTKSDSAAGHVDSDAFFDLAVNGADSWGEPSAMLPVDFTPRKSTLVAQPSKDHTDNCDAFSYDASEMSEVTNPTYASATVMHNALATTRPDPDGDDARRKGECAKKTGMDQKSMQAMHEPRESAMPLLGGGTGDKSDASIEGKENQQRGGKPYKSDRGENAPVSIASSDTASYVIEKLGVVKSNDNARFDIDQGTMTNIPRVAKSRIMAKYAKSGKVRRTNESLGTIHSTPVSINKNEPPSPTRSIGTAASSSSVSRTGSQQQGAKVSTAKKSSSRSSAEPHLGRKSDNASASAKASEAVVQSLRNANNTQLQPISLQQGINPATTSSLAYRRGRKSPMRQLTSATSGNISPKSIEVRGSPKRSPTDKYGASNRKKKVSPSVVDNPAYYSVRVPWS